jgi:CBS domain-containing protein
MRVHEIMTTDVATCGPGTNLAEAAGMMWNRDCGVLPVVDASGHVTAVITDRDICMAAATKGRPASRIAVGEAASDRLFAVGPDDDLTTALQAMAAHRVRRLPVIGPAGELRGIVSINDIVLCADRHEVPAPAILEAMQGICAHRQIVAAAS